MRVLQINSVANSGSTGRIAEEIGNVLMAHGHESYIAYGRGCATSTSKLIKIGSQKDVYLHGAYTLLTDKHGFASKSATKEFIQEVEKINPDLIALHNLHGYYLNIEILFEFLKNSNIPVTWTFHDCWPFTGHCSYFDDISCTKWQNTCYSCPKSRNYPKAYVDNSIINFNKKKQVLNGVCKLKIITPSLWLKNLTIKSFLDYDIFTINNGIDLNKFNLCETEKLLNNFFLFNKKIILGCASAWTNRKGYQDFISLSKKLSEEHQIVMIGLNAKEIESLPNNIIGLQRTESIEELAQWYSLAYVFVNPTSQDNFPTTNLEALACGTPVITYDTGGSPEAIDEHTGFVLEKGDVNGIVEKIEMLKRLNYEVISKACRARAERLYDKKTRYLDYLKVFEGMVQE
jgi:putative colanic acid biosynthesis glycosyltransferase